MAKAKAAVPQFHQVQGEGKYTHGLQNVNDTIATTDNVLNLFSNPSKILSFLFILALVALVILLFRGQLNKLWAALKKPFEEAWTDVKVGEQVRTSGFNSIPQLAINQNQEESSDLQFSNDDARHVAEAIAGCWGGFWGGDDTDVLFSLLRRIPGPRSFQLTDGYYRQLYKTYNDGLWNKRTTTDIISDMVYNLSASEQQTAKSILAARNINFDTTEKASVSVGDVVKTVAPTWLRLLIH